MKQDILFVSHSAELYGAERMLLQVLKGIDKAKFNPYLILPAHGPFEEESKRLNIPTVIIPFKWWITEKSQVWKQPFAWIWNFKSVFGIINTIRRWKISLVFSNSSVAFSGALAARVVKIPHVWSVHEILNGKESLVCFLLGNRTIVRWISRLSTRVIVNSSATRRAFAHDKKVRLIYNGLDTRHLDVPSMGVLRESLGLEEQDIVLGVVGKIYRGKGQREVILALDSLRRSHPRLRLLIVGEIKDQTYYHELRKIVDERDLGDHVYFTGYRQDVFNLLHLMDVLVIASTVDSFGLVALESMAVGTPVLAVAEGGLLEIITHGQNGFLLESSEPEKIAEGVEGVLQNPSRLAEIREQGLRTVKDKFTSAKHIKKTEDVIDECFEQEREDG